MSFVPPVVLRVLLVVLLAAPALAGEWRLVFEDDFRRDELGPDWQVFRGSATIINNQLQLLEAGACLLIDRPFADDVRLEFAASPLPGVPPCDLSCTLAASPHTGMTYLFALGTDDNRQNQIHGPGLREVDECPPRLIEQDMVHVLTATREGRCLRFMLDNELLLEGESDELLGGPGFDRVGLVTWNGMLVDWVKVYERDPPHPDTPRYDDALPQLPLERRERVVRYRGERAPRSMNAAVTALNAGDHRRAIVNFAGVRDMTKQLVGLLFVLSDPLYEEQPDELWGFAQLWEAQAREHPRDPVLQGMREAVDLFGRLVHDRSGLRPAALLCERWPEDNPMLHKALLYRGRIQYMLADPEDDDGMQRSARQWLEDLHAQWPELELLREYVGESVPWGEALIACTASHPPWAAYLHEALARQHTVLAQCLEDMQLDHDAHSPDFWLDGVTLLQAWTPLAAIAPNAATDVTVGLSRLAEGVWRKAQRHGLGHDADDAPSLEALVGVVEAMLLLHDGDPVWTKRAMRLAREIRDGRLERDAGGHLRIRSNGEGDSGLDAPLMAVFPALARVGIPDAGAYFVDWAEGWRHWTMHDQADKPAGIAPATIWRPTGVIEPPAGGTWFDRESSHGAHDTAVGLVFDALLTAHDVSGREDFLTPLQRTMTQRNPQTYRRQRYHAPGHEAWLEARWFQQGLPARTAVYRSLTGRTDLDEHIAREGNAWQRFMVNGDLESLCHTLEQEVLPPLRVNLAMHVARGVAAHRAALPGDALVWGAYSGAATLPGRGVAPTWAVTYDAADPRFAALVERSLPDELDVRLYGFGDEVQPLDLRIWRLRPGQYSLAMHALAGDAPDATRTVDLIGPGDTLTLHLPPRQEVRASLRLLRAREQADALPDLALAAREMQVDEHGVLAVAHNIGNATLERATLALQARVKEGWQTLDEVGLPVLPAPVDLIPATVALRLRFPANPPPGPWRVLGQAQQMELREGNNHALLP